MRMILLAVSAIGVLISVAAAAKLQKLWEVGVFK